MDLTNFTTEHKPSYASTLFLKAATDNLCDLWKSLKFITSYTVQAGFHKATCDTVALRGVLSICNQSNVMLYIIQLGYSRNKETKLTKN